MAYIALREERHSFAIIKRTKEFVINLTPPELLETADWCGIYSGRDYDKWKERGLTPVAGTAVKAPLIAECPVNIECKVTEIKELGTHFLFLAEIVAVDADEAYVKGERLDLAEFSTVANVGGNYVKVDGLIDPLRFMARKK
jgi:flavin reductase (DIM6/NTAB) family NADH-FMN oxidoreductase RutF